MNSTDLIPLLSLNYNLHKTWRRERSHTMTVGHFLYPISFISHIFFFYYYYYYYYWKILLLLRGWWNKSCLPTSFAQLWRNKTVLLSMIHHLLLGCFHSFSFFNCKLTNIWKNPGYYQTIVKSRVNVARRVKNRIFFLISFSTAMQSFIYFLLFIK